MAAVVGRVSRQTLLKAKSAANTPQANFSFKSASKGKKRALLALGTAAVGGLGIVGAALGAPVLASDLTLHPPHHLWNHLRFWQSIDMKSVRRGWEVYKGVCSACHSVKYLYYREMVGAFMTEEEAKREAKAAMIKDGPDTAGNMFERPGKLADKVPKPYPNSEAAKAANNGIEPPDLTYIVKAREGGEDYVFSLLTGYCDPPAGVEVMADGHFNPYYDGGIIAMAPPIYTDIIEYTDGTPATKSQLAKDVVTFLAWTANSDDDDRKKLTFKVYAWLTGMLIISYYAKRHYFSVLKARKIALIKKKK